MKPIQPSGDQSQPRMRAASANRAMNKVPFRMDGHELAADGGED